MSAILQKAGDRYGETEWRNHNMRTACRTESDVEHSEKTRYEIRQLTNESQIKVAWDNYDNSERLCARIQEVEQAAVSSQKILAELDTEIAHLHATSAETGEQLEQRHYQLLTCQEALTTREQRMCSELVSDTLDSSLHDEAKAVEHGREQIQQQLTLVSQQLQKLLETRHQLLANSNDLQMAAEVDRKTLALTRHHTDILADRPSHSCGQLPHNQLLTSAQWRQEAADLHQTAQRQLTASRQLRQELAEVVSAVVNTLARRHEETQAANRHRLHQLRQYQHHLRGQQKKLSGELEAISAQLRHSSSAVRNAATYRQLAATRIERRTEQPSTQLTYDRAWQGLSEQHQEAAITGQQLQNSVDRLQRVAGGLRRQLQLVDKQLKEVDITINIDTLCHHIHSRASCHSHNESPLTMPHGAANSSRQILSHQRPDSIQTQCSPHTQLPPATLGIATVLRD